MGEAEGEGNMDACTSVAQFHTLSGLAVVFRVLVLGILVPKIKNCGLLRFWELSLILKRRIWVSQVDRESKEVYRVYESFEDSAA